MSHGAELHLVIEEPNTKAVIDVFGTQKHFGAAVHIKVVEGKVHVEIRAFDGPSKSRHVETEIELKPHDYDDGH